MAKYNHRALGWFILINALFASLISTRFFIFFPAELVTWLSTVFVITSTIGQMSLLAMVIGLFLLPALFLQQTPRRLVIALIGALGLMLLFMDTIVFAQYRFHINAVVVGLILAGDIVSFPLTVWLMVIGGLVAVLILEFWLVSLLERKQQSIKPKLGRKLGYSIFAVFIVANLIHAWAFAYANQPVSMVSRYLPLYYPLTANSQLQKLGWVDLVAIEQQRRLKVDGKGGFELSAKPYCRAGSTAA